MEEHRWINWKDVLQRNDSRKEFDPTLTYHELIVPTTENLKNSYILNLCIKNSLPVLFVGPTGTGKSVLVQRFLRSLPSEAYTTAFMCFSAKTTAAQTQELIDSRLEKRGRKVMAPPFGKKCVIFIDDLNMPALERYGAQPPIELLRQWMDHKGWFDTKEKEKQFKELIDLIFISAMGPPGGGKNPITPRYLRHFNLISINNFEE
jgi:dynein heavy chain